MRYFIDTEFHECKKRGVNTIELISIGLVGEDGREYYAICKEFNTWKAWKNEFLRKKVIPHLFGEVKYYPTFKRLIEKHGKTRKMIAQKVKDFVSKKDYLKNLIIERDKDGSTFGVE